MPKRYMDKEYSTKKYGTQEMNLMSELCYKDLNDKLKKRLKDGTLTVKMLADLKYTGETDPAELELYKRITEGECANWKIVGYDNYDNKDSVVKSNSGMAALIISPGEGQAIVAFRGSEDPKTHINDWRDNAELIYQTDTSQQIDAKNYVNKFFNEHPEYNDIALAGHSKGGNDALYTSLTVDKAIRDKISSCTTFNAPGFNNDFIEKYLSVLDEEGMRSRMKEYQNEYDLTSSILNNLTNPIIFKSRNKISNIFNFNNHSNSSAYLPNGEAFVEIPTKNIGCSIVNTITCAVQHLPGVVHEFLIDIIIKSLNGEMGLKEASVLLITGIVAAKIIGTLGIVLIAELAVILLAIVAICVLVIYFDEIKAALSKGIEAVYQCICDFFDSVAHKTENMINSTIESLSEAGTAIKGTYDDIKSSFTGAVDSFGKSVDVYCQSTYKSVQTDYRNWLIGSSKLVPMGVVNGKPTCVALSSLQNLSVRLNKAKSDIADSTQYMIKDVKNTVRDIENSYNEQYVRKAAIEVEKQLSKIEKLYNLTSGELEQKSRSLQNSVDMYNTTEKKLQLRINEFSY